MNYGFLPVVLLGIAIIYPPHYGEREACLRYLNAQEVPVTRTQPEQKPIPLPTITMNACNYRVRTCKP